MNANDDQQPDRLLTMDELRRQVPLSSSKIYRMMREGTFPAQIRLGPNRVAWRLSDITAWIDARQRGTATA